MEFHDAAGGMRVEHLLSREVVDGHLCVLCVLVALDVERAALQGGSYVAGGNFMHGGSYVQYLEQSLGGIVLVFS